MSEYKEYKEYKEGTTLYKYLDEQWLRVGSEKIRLYNNTQIAFGNIDDNIYTFTGTEKDGIMLPNIKTIIDIPKNQLLEELRELKQKINTKFDVNGINEKGFNEEGFNEEGFNEEGFNEEGFDEKGFDRDGFDKEGFNREGFNKHGLHRNAVLKQGGKINNNGKRTYYQQG